MTPHLLVGAVAAMSLSGCIGAAPTPDRPRRWVVIRSRGHDCRREDLIGDQGPPVPYSSSPPTSGWHASGAFSIAVHRPGDPLSEPMQVSVLGAGGVVVAYRDLLDEDRVVWRSMSALLQQRQLGDRPRTRQLWSIALASSASLIEVVEAT